MEIEQTSDTSVLTRQQYVDYAVLHCFERAYVLPGRQLETDRRHRIGNSAVPSADIEKCFQQDKRVLCVEEKPHALCITREVLSEEKRMVDLASAKNMNRIYNHQNLRKYEANLRHITHVLFISFCF